MTEERNPMLRRLAKNAKQSKAYHASKGAEKKLAVRVGGYTTAGSGNKLEKGDVRKRGVARLEHKMTQNKSFSVTREMVEKITNAAYASEEIPAIIVEFINARSGKSEGEIACIPVEYLLRLLEDGRTR